MRDALRLFGLLALGVVVGLVASLVPARPAARATLHAPLPVTRVAHDDSPDVVGRGQEREPPAPSRREKPAVAGLLTFRGNATRTYYGQGPVPDEPSIAWTYPEAAMCAESSVGDETKQWCGTGWTGQPAVFRRNRQTWLVFGAYDRQVHFVDARSGLRLLPPFPTGDIIKGSVTVDPDGFPLVYVGSRDNHYRVLAIDRGEPVQLWSLAADATSPTLWNNDWDSSGLVVDDHLFVGGENSRVHVVKLNRRYDRDGLVTVKPELVFDAAGWDDELLSALGDSNVSIESSVTLVGDVLYFTNSGGLVQGWDMSRLAAGRAPRRVFRFWTGDDTDATIVADDEGMLYVASQWQRHNSRAAEVGQIIKLDPSRPRNPLVWSVHDRGGELAGVWATPALHRDVLYVPTHGGELLAISRDDGRVRWRKQLAGPVWSSPVVVDDVLLQGDCAGVLHAYDVRRTRAEPREVWQAQLTGCIESTPAVWKGGIYVGTRAGFMNALTARGR